LLLLVAACCCLLLLVAACYCLLLLDTAWYCLLLFVLLVFVLSCGLWTSRDTSSTTWSCDSKSQVTDQFFLAVN
jgi:hypothetical protein